MQVVTSDCAEEIRYKSGAIQQAERFCIEHTIIYPAKGKVVIEFKDGSMYEEEVSWTGGA